ncbi:hypothetical protein L6164_002448 [Bauhinia variegata]|uniref:Uncharacterized protein n=1 Tax=Bauhinia variegata TaxID=167791 RepID=A0ACB9PYD6_BAUVA|nr:hypothetical protein L6164_002448 [Bauhinia variegata]
MENPTGNPSTENKMEIVNIQPPLPPGSPPEAIISPNFCAPYPIDLRIVRELITVRGGHFYVLDVNGKVVFQMRRNLFSIRECQILSDAGGNPIVSLHRKVLPHLS